MSLSEHELIRYALTLNHELNHAVQIVSKAVSITSFPIASKDDFLDLFAKAGDAQSCTLDGITFTRAQAASYFPARFCPVVNERDMLQKVYAALLHGKRMHQLSDELKLHQQHISSTEKL
jgi:hypothetical protein